MGIRQATTTEGRRISFDVDNHYYTPLCDKSLVFDGFFKDHKFCVCYTKICNDSGYREETRFGTPTLVHYDNGLVAYQNMNFFNDKKEAEEDFKNRKKLTPKLGVYAYADVFLVEND
jgi:hypothetical protein